jgi:predicted AlkP superfamily pyrophosphatase or phosphodiesterase
MKILSGIFSLFLAVTVSAQSNPKIVVGMMVDQMRWDYLVRYSNRYSENGFKRLLKEGFTCENTYINYAPTITACGHTAVYTGSVPAVHGIAGNSWFDRSLNRSVYCTEDSSVLTVGSSSSSAGKMSPKNLLTTTIGDELRIATNFKSRVVGIALKDRASILPAGHTANAAFWYDGQSGNFISSSYYMAELPLWAKQFNEKKLVEKYLNNDWNTLYPIDTYKASTADNKSYEKSFGHEKAPVFPHQLMNATGKSYGMIRSTPFGNSFTFDFAKAAIEGYGLGKGAVTDLLAVSFSSPDAIGHQFGPNSVETEDNYLRLDKDLADFLHYLDLRFGKNGYLFFLTADHGVSHSPGYEQENKLPGGVFKDPSAVLNTYLKEKTAIDKVVIGIDNYQLYLDKEAIIQKHISLSSVEEMVIDFLIRQPGVANAISTRSLGSANLPEPAKTMFINGQHAKRSGDILLIIEQGWKVDSGIGADHGLWYPDDAHIPLVWMGWGISHNKTNRLVGITDIAPTLAALLHIQSPSGSVGKVITEITDRPINKK